MKKLMIAAAIVCASAMSQAASMAWGEGERLYTPDTTKGGAWTETSLGSNGKAYLFELTAVEYAALYVAGDYAATAQKVFDEYASFGSNGKISVTGADQNKASSGGKIKSFTDSRTFFAGEGNVGNTAYAAMIITTTGDDGRDYYIANLASYTFDADIDGENSDLGHWQFGDSTSAGKTEITGWTTQAVPEPTSGLLLLLGVAGLALRRRRV